MDHQEEEDTVVDEFDVYMMKAPEDCKLYVVQYPLKPNWQHYDLDEPCKQIRVKPSTGEIEIDLSVNKESDNISSQHPMVKADSEIIQRLKATWDTPMPNRNSYAIGVVVGKNICLNPIDHITQLRPSVLAKKDLGKEEQNNTEIWVPLRYHSADSDTSAGYLQKMMVLPPLEERLRNWLVEGPPVHRFGDLMYHLMYFASGHSAEDVLRILKKHALLVQGLWVPKTRTKIPEESPSIRFTRDCILFLFNKSPIIRYDHLEAFKDTDECNKILREFATERPASREWKFNEPTDHSFMQKYPSIVAEQQHLWRTVRRNALVSWTEKGQAAQAAREAAQNKPS